VCWAWEEGWKAAAAHFAPRGGQLPREPAPRPGIGVRTPKKSRFGSRMASNGAPRPQCGRHSANGAGVRVRSESAATSPPARPGLHWPPRPRSLVVHGLPHHHLVGLGHGGLGSHASGGGRLDAHGESHCIGLGCTGEFLDAM